MPDDGQIVQSPSLCDLEGLGGQPQTGQLGVSGSGDTSTGAPRIQDNENRGSREPCGIAVWTAQSRMAVPSASF